MFYKLQVATGSVETYVVLQEQMSRVLERLTRVENVQKMLVTDKRSKRFTKISDNYTLRAHLNCNYCVWTSH